jgi:signal transduction histidine kinase
VSHDLRTPITRLRLRSEFIADPALRAQMLDELTRMNTMVESILVYLRGGSPREPATMIDIATSLHTICDQFADLGHNVGYDGPDHLAIEAHPEELRRAITNLVDNAVRHGGNVTVRLAGSASTVSIAVEDDGPGILDADKDSMQQPFVRGDAARGMNDHGGFGLGLAIARTAVVVHGGTLELIDRVPRGLIARLTMPTCRRP